MKLIANGCSNTAGSEIDPSDLKFCHAKAWPRWVADHFNIDYENIATPGAGNEQITRTTLLYVSKLLDLGVLPSDLVVMVAWSGFDRYEFWCPESQCHKSFTFNTQATPYIPKEPIKSYIKYRSLVEPENYSNYKSLYYVFQLSTFLEQHKIKYFFSNALQTFELQANFKGSDNLKSEYFELLDLYGKKRIDNHLGFFYSPHTFVNYLSKLPRTGLGAGGHWGEDGQKRYAELFVKHIEAHGGLAHLGEH